jgi:hypothetical protein
MDPASADGKRMVQRRLDRAAAMFVRRVRASDTVRRVVKEAIADLRNGDAMVDTARIRLLGDKYGLTVEELAILREQIKSARADVDVDEET